MLRLFALSAARAVGLFWVARRLTADNLRILCYHGGSVHDEHEYKPGLFMTKQTFEKRLELLRRWQYPVLELGEALQHLDRGTLPSGATVITIDDGWFGTYSEMAPALKEAALPATLYVATYYMEKGTQVFNVAAGYVLWKARSKSLRIEDVIPEMTGRFVLSNALHRDRIVEKLEKHGEGLDAASRQVLLRRLCVVLGIDGDSIEKARQCAFMSLAEAAQLTTMGIDLQLHTHRHRFPDDQQLALNEILDNRRVLASISDSPTTHFCYPSGQYAVPQVSWLEPWGIRSAVTTDRGLARSDSDRLLLPRILDSEAATEIEFEAEMSGFRQLLRKMRLPRAGVNK